MSACLGLSSAYTWMKKLSHVRAITTAVTTLVSFRVLLADPNVRCSISFCIGEGPCCRSFGDAGDAGGFGDGLGNSVLAFAVFRFLAAAALT